MFVFIFVIVIVVMMLATALFVFVVMMFVMVFVLVLIVVFVVVMMLVFVFVLVVIIVVVMMSATTLFVFVVMMFVMMLVVVFFVFFQHFFCHFERGRGGSFHSGKDILAVQFVDRRGDDGRVVVVFFDVGERFFDFRLRGDVRVAQNDAVGVFELVKEKFAEVFGVHKAFFGVYDRRFGIDLNTVQAFFHRGGDVRKFAHARRFDNDTVGVKFFGHFFERFGKIADQTATNATAVHLRDFYSGVFQKTAVDTDFAEFVFDQDDFFSVIRFFYELFDQSGLPRTEKTRKNIDFHINLFAPLYSFIFIK